MTGGRTRPRMRSADSASEDKKKERLFRPTEEAAKCGEAEGRKWVLVKSPDHRMRSYKKKSKRRMKKGKAPMKERRDDSSSPETILWL